MDPSSVTPDQPAPKSRANMTEEEKRLLKEEKKAAKEAAKRLKAERKAAAAAAAADAIASANALISGIEFLTVDNTPQSAFGTYRVIQSKCPPDGSGRVFVPIAELEGVTVGSEVWVRARVHRAVFTAQVAFLTLRKGLDTAQAVLEGKELLKWGRKNLSTESIVDVNAVVNTPEGGRVEKCSVGTVELAVSRVYVVSRAEDKLPLTLDDAARGVEDDVVVEEAEKSQSRPRVTRDTRLDARFVDLRAPPHGSLMRVQSGVCQLFREFLLSQGFMEIHSPKLIAGASEGGSDVFALNYFERQACLAQSPQLYKQMAICSDFQRVFEIGPVFRAEKSDTHRHLCEFTGLDLEMEIFEHYNEILEVLDGLFVAIFDGLEQRHGKELGVVRSKWNVPKFRYWSGKANLRLKWPEAIAMLREHGVEIGDFEDLNTEKEKLLGRLVREKYDTDFFMLTHFPSAIRPFYTMVDPVDPRYSNSYDLFMRGEEIVSGAQRIHDVELLTVRATAMLGEAGIASIKDYVDAFRFGAPPHGGAGIGLERVVMLYLGIENIRECSLFPRDPQRLTP
eukprot:GFKZ01014938.1.p1 GENE.GFKZ01014938.1~~GFKZ01014938.1.p1  ORF type:complete len:564 (-),score=95.90 GFKZ01014938.1:100-1791(-)